tara:strand:- start:259 stop:654 length:396 start_codon:yes stop_codon:yes gene_type:complete
LKNNTVYFAVLFTIFLGVLSLVKMPSNGIPAVTSDKVLHAIAYFFLMYAWLYTFAKDINFRKKLKYIVLACLIYGIVIEVLQGEFTTYRTGSYLDILANTVGVVIAVLAFHLFKKNDSFSVKTFQSYNNFF